MTINTALVITTEQQTTTAVDLTAFIETLSPVLKHEYLEQHNLSGEKFLVCANDELYVTLQNTDGELTGVKQITGPQVNSVISTGNEKAGFFRFPGDDTKLVLLANDYLTAHKAHELAGYNTVMISSPDDLASIKEQLAPFTDEIVVIYCYIGSIPENSSIASLGIEIFDLSSSADFESRMKKTIQRAKLRIPKGYRLKEDGVYAICIGKDNVEVPIWLCSPLKVSALTRDIKSTRWGRYVEVLDDDGITHSFAMPMEQLIGKSFINPLVNRGLTFSLDGVKDVNDYLMKAKPIQRARSVSKTGWYENLFVLPNKVIGETDEQVVYQNSSSTLCNFEELGVLKQWQDNVSSLAKGNTRLAFGISTAFATMVLPLVGGESGGIHFRGGSSRGKTTILTIAKSVLGNPESLPRWSSTVNGLEALASNHNHTLLCLDELSQLAEVSPKNAGEAVYQLGNGQGKQRMKNNGELSEATSWQLLYLSTGEVSLQSVFKTAGLQVRAGQEVRFIDLPADASAGLGAFDTVQNFPDGNHFSLAIKESALKYYGTAATAFLEKVTADYEGVKQQLINNMAEFIALLDLTNADPQVQRVAQRFAQIAASGKVATTFGITGWDEDEAYNAALACFSSWMDARGGDGSQEAKTALEQVAGKLISWGPLRFSTTGQAAARNGQVWGVKDDNFFHVYPEIFKTVLCQGLDVKTVENTLLDVGVLIPSTSRRTVQKKVEGKNMRFYKLDKKILELAGIEAEVA